MKKFFIILCVCVLCFTLFFACNKRNEEDVKPPLGDLTKNLDENLAKFINDLFEVENAAIEYYGQDDRDWMLAAINFTRTKRYDTSAWRLVGGKTDKPFLIIMEENHADLMYMRDLKSLKTPGNIEVDIIHEMATISGNINSGSKSAWDLCGHGGDIAQFAIELRDTHLEGDELYEKASELFLDEKSTFPASDFYADIDAFNIAKIMKDNIWECSYAMAIYYSSDKYMENRISDFGKNSLDLKSKSEYSKNNLYTVLTENNFIKRWCKENGFDLQNDSEYFKVAVDVFIDEFYKE